MSKPWATLHERGQPKCYTEPDLSEVMRLDYQRYELAKRSPRGDQKSCWNQRPSGRGLAPAAQVAGEAYDLGGMLRVQHLDI